jgi:hypothetical protein
VTLWWRSQRASSRSGKSERTCPPRVSSREVRARESTCPRCSRLVVSQVTSAPVLPRGRLCARVRPDGFQPSAVESAERTGPEPSRHGALEVHAVEASSSSASSPRCPSRPRAAGRSPDAEPGRDVVGDAVGEDQALEQGVGGQPVGAVHSGAGALAAGVEPVEGVRPCRSVSTPPRRSAAPARPAAGRSPGRSRAHRHEATIEGKRCSRNSAEVARVEEDVVDPRSRMTREDGPRDHVTRREVGEFVPPCMIRAPVAVDEERALPAHGFGDERLLPGRSLAEEQHRRVELDELEVGDPRPGAQRGGHPVAGRDRAGWSSRRRSARGPRWPARRPEARPRRRRRSGPRR